MRLHYIAVTLHTTDSYIAAERAGADGSNAQAARMAGQSIAMCREARPFIDGNSRATSSGNCLEYPASINRDLQKYLGMPCKAYTLPASNVRYNASV